MLVHKPNTSEVLLILVALLVLVIGIQAWYLLGMHKKSSMLYDPTCNKPDSILLSPLDDEWLKHHLDDDRWDPLQEMKQIQGRIKNTLGYSIDLFYRNKHSGDIFNSTNLTPSINVKEEKNRFDIRVDLPETENSNIDVRLDGQQLTIEVIRKNKIEKKNENQHLLPQESRMRKFSHTLTLPSPVKQDGMQTHFNNGVLEITVPKA
jgi:HSP20 family protein